MIIKIVFINIVHVNLKNLKSIPQIATQSKFGC